MGWQGAETVIPDEIPAAVLAMWLPPGPVREPRPRWLEFLRWLVARGLVETGRWYRRPAGMAGCWVAGLP